MMPSQLAYHPLFLFSFLIFTFSILNKRRASWWFIQTTMHPPHQSIHSIFIPVHTSKIRTMFFLRIFDTFLHMFLSIFGLSGVIFWYRYCILVSVLYTGTGRVVPKARLRGIIPHYFSDKKKKKKILTTVCRSP